jgi:dTMP kinase
VTPRFLVIEGLDGAGTTTQSARLIAWFTARGHRAVATREPTDGPIGRLIRTTLRAEAGSPDPTVLPWMFAADRADHLHRIVEPTLAGRASVVSDRYLHSSLAYQSLTLPLSEVWALNHTFRVPDLTLFLRVPVAECLRRMEGRPEREIYEEESRLVKISASYDATMAFLRERGHAIVTIDGSLPVDDVTAAILAAL